MGWAIFLITMGAVGLIEWTSSDEDTSEEQVDDTPAEQPEDPQVCDGIEILVEGDATLVETTECDDLILTDVDSANNITVEAGDGADTLTGSEYLSDSELFGEDGDDVITDAGYANTLHGGAGDDTLSSDGARATLFGDEGDDHLTLEGRITNFERMLADGGEGDDTLVSGFGLPDQVSQSVNSTLSGGAGADRFELEVLASDLTQHSFDGTFDTGITIDDFESGEDVLVIDPYSNFASNDASFSRFEVVPSADASGTHVVLYYTHPDLPEERGIAVELAGAAGVTASDVQIVGGVTI
ncbi:hypothetical protein NBRC116590_38560 [Pelagimonas sp. KU-00592-HH]|uniref:calcium-binding protein n=1 Tax=Pelagimonas sp. KU-00592-HH TaxID=3127651 RepID=UPI0031061529